MLYEIYKYRQLTGSQLPGPTFWSNSFVAFLDPKGPYNWENGKKVRVIGRDEETGMLLKGEAIVNTGKNGPSQPLISTEVDNHPAEGNVKGYALISTGMFTHHGKEFNLAPNESVDLISDGVKVILKHLSSSEETQA